MNGLGLKGKVAIVTGAGGGIGNQNYAANFDFGLSDDSLFSIYFVFFDK